MKNWRSTIGGAFSAAGGIMVGIGVVPQLAGTPTVLPRISKLEAEVSALNNRK